MKNNWLALFAYFAVMTVSFEFGWTIGQICPSKIQKEIFNMKLQTAYIRGSTDNIRDSMGRERFYKSPKECADTLMP